MQSVFYLYILKVIHFIKNEYYSNARTKHISIEGEAVLTIFTQITRDIIFER